jgi:isopenicillin N synthase-like dioxygenase
MNGIPTLDLADFTHGDPQRKNKFIDQLGRTYQDIGFVAIKNHLLSDDLEKRLYAACKAFFDLPDDIKMKYARPDIGGQRGYTPKGQEHAKGRNVGDLKEFYHVGPELPAERLAQLGYPTNIFPEEIPDFGPSHVQAFYALENTGRRMLQALALFLGLDENYFEPHVVEGVSILRSIHYFPIEDPDSVPEDAVRAAAHEDINLITLLMGASAEGLEVLDRKGNWVPITAVPACVVVNVGDMLQRLTNHRLVSTTHRVVNPPREKMNTPRYSIPFFLHPKPTMSLACLDSCVDADHPKRYPDATAGEYLNERLVEIGLIKK